MSHDTPTGPTAAMADDMTLDRFRYRSSTFLFAASRTDPTDLTYLHQGTADQMRAHTRANLVCPEPTCGSPDLTTVNRAQSGNRDGFRHHRKDPAGAHAPETALHRQGKALVHRWASGLPQVAEARMEVSLGGGERIADVLLTSHTGNRLAVEVQFSDLSVPRWIERTRSYLHMGIPVVWMFGAIGKMSPLTAALRAVHKEVVDERWPLLWINPIEEVVGWATRHDGALLSSEHSTNSVVRFCGLENLDLRATGIYPPGFLAARAAHERTHEAKIRRGLEALREEVQRRGVTRAENLSPSRTLAAPKPTRKALCRRCGLPLADFLAASGVHVVGDCNDAHW